MNTQASIRRQNSQTFHVRIDHTGRRKITNEEFSLLHEKFTDGLDIKEMMQDHKKMVELED